MANNFFYFLIVAIIFTACKTTLNTNIPAIENFYIVDFTEFTEKGFLFTPEKYLGEYESIGLFNYYFTTEANLKVVGEDEYGYKTYKWIEGEYSLQESLNIVYYELLELNANGVMNLQIEAIESSNPRIKEAYLPSGYIIKGFAIKRL